MLLHSVKFTHTAGRRGGAPERNSGPHGAAGAALARPSAKASKADPKTQTTNPPPYASMPSSLAERSHSCRPFSPSATSSETVFSNEPAASEKDQ